MDNEDIERDALDNMYGGGFDGGFGGIAHAEAGSPGRGSNPIESSALYADGLVVNESRMPRAPPFRRRSTVSDPEQPPHVPPEPVRKRGKPAEVVAQPDDSVPIGEPDSAPLAPEPAPAAPDVRKKRNRTLKSALALFLLFLFTVSTLFVDNFLSLFGGAVSGRDPTVFGTCLQGTFLVIAFAVSRYIIARDVI